MPHKRKPSSYAEKYILNVPDPGKELPNTRPPIKRRSSKGIIPFRQANQEKQHMSTADRNGILIVIVVAIYIFYKMFS